MSWENFDVRSQIVLPENWETISKEEQDKFARDNFYIAEKEFEQISRSKDKVIGIRQEQYRKILWGFNAYKDEQRGPNVKQWVGFFKNSGGSGRIYLSEIDEMYQYRNCSSYYVPDILWDYYKRHPEKDKREKKEKADRENVNKSYGSRPYLSTLPTGTGNLYGPEKHKVTYGKDGNKHYQTRPVKYDSLDELWILIPVLLFLCLTGPGGVIFGIIALVVYFRYVEVRTQRSWESECDFVELVRTGGSEVNNNNQWSNRKDEGNESD